MKFLIIVSVLISCAIAGRVRVEGCNGLPAPIVEIDNCNMNECIVKNHSYLKVKAIARTPLDAKKLRMTATAKWFIIYRELEFDEKDRDMCRIIPEGCPVKKGQTLEATMGFRVDSPISGINPTITMMIRNERYDNIVCAKVDIKLRS